MAVSAQEKADRKAAYVEAGADLRAAHAEEWEKHYQTRLEAKGLAYKPRLTEAQRLEREAEERRTKAREKVAALVLEFGPDILPEDAEPDADKDWDGK